MTPTNGKYTKHTKLTHTKHTHISLASVLHQRWLCFRFKAHGEFQAMLEHLQQIKELFDYAAHLPPAVATVSASE